MAQSSNRLAVRQLRSLFDVGTCAGLTDGQLLDRFLHRGGEASELAFAALVERHGPMVLRVCRRILSDPADAEDAFQAVFLVLVRRAGSVRKRDSLASWLHGVALRVAGASRSARSRRMRHERIAAEQRSVATNSEWASDDLAAVLHDEIGRLPDRYRAAVVLCYLEGRTYDEAAAALGCPVGTIKSRLATARQMLGTRLARRGFAVSAGAVVASLDGETASASVGRSLVDATLRSAMRNICGRAAIAGSIAAHWQGGLGMIAAHKIRLTLLVALCIGTAGARVYVRGQQPKEAGDAARSPAEPDSDVRAHAGGNQKTPAAQIVRATPESIERKLEKPVSFSSDDHPTLGSAISYLAGRTGLSIVIDPKALADLGLTLGSKVNLVCHDVPLASVLNMLLHPMKLDYFVEDKLVLVSERPVHEVIDRVYRLEDLLQAAGDRKPESMRFWELMDIADIIQSSVAPGTWVTSAKRKGVPQLVEGVRIVGKISVDRYQMTLTVRHEEVVHDQIALRIAQLRRLTTGKDAAPVTSTMRPSPVTAKGAKAPQDQRVTAIFIPSLVAARVSEVEAQRIRDSFLKAVGESTHYRFVDKPGEADLIMEWALATSEVAQGGAAVHGRVYVSDLNAASLNRRSEAYMREVVMKALEGVTPLKVSTQPEDADYILEWSLVPRPKPVRNDP